MPCRTPDTYPRFLNLERFFTTTSERRYFNEIGPFDLYACAIAADRDTTQIWSAATPVRDLHTYALVPVNSLVCPRERFTPQRWAAFLRDFSWIIGTARPDEWALALTDKGYNATPFFSQVFADVIEGATVLRLDSTGWQWIVFNLDLIFLAITGWIVWNSAGLTIALLVLVLALGFFGNFGRIGGNLGQVRLVPMAHSRSRSVARSAAGVRRGGAGSRDRVSSISCVLRDPRPAHWRPKRDSV